MWAKGLWRGAGVFNVEEFDPDPFLAELGPQGLPWVEKFDIDLEVLIGLESVYLEDRTILYRPVFCYVPGYYSVDCTVTKKYGAVFYALCIFLPFL